MTDLFLENFDELTRRADRSGIQDSVAMRNVLLCRKLASVLITDKGDIDQSKVSNAITDLKRSLYSLEPDRQYDARRREHILNVLFALQSDKEAQRLLRSLGHPPSNRLIDQFIRLTLDLPEHVALTDADARKAGLAAWFTYLRQTVGSCFATAPAIIIQMEQPLQFLQDLNELFATGRLTRTFGGVEHAVPLSISWGAGDLKKAILFRGEEGFEHLQLWLSPGLMAGIEMAAMVDKQATLKQKIQSLKQLLKNLFIEALQRNGVVATNPNLILEALLFNHLSISRKDFEDFQKRKENLPPPGILGSSSATPQGKEKALVQFAATLEKMKDAFKLLTECPLLKAWEFTLASFAETKAQFITWNLYASLGLQPDQPHGIGDAIYKVLQERMEQANRKVQDLQLEYEQMYGQVNYLQGRMQRASTEKEIQWLKIEYQTKAHEFQMLGEQRDKAQHKAQRISGLLQTIVEQLIELFPRFFQEIYDADLRAVESGPYDDSPAGFRLIFKHGRSNTAQWTSINSPEEFVDALYHFFTMIESDLSVLSEFTHLEHELSEVITAVAKQIRTKEFLISSFERMAAYHKTPLVKNPLENLEKIAKKPWAYTSGGTMGSLVSNYFRLETPPKDTSRWVENSMELLVFFIDSIKQIPPKEMSDFVKEKRSSILTHSPTHAFLIKPFYPLFEAAWKNEAFTYTWVRDQVVLPMMRRVDDIHLDRPQMDYLIDKLKEFVPPDNRYYFGKTFAQFPYEYTSVEFREYLFKQMEGEKGLQIGGRAVLAEELSAQFFYKSLPLIHRNKFYEAIVEIFSAENTLTKELKTEIVKNVNNGEIVSDEEFIPSHQLLKICKTLVAKQTNLKYWPTDLHASFLTAMRQTGYALAEPFRMADTNWMRDDFGFVVSPATGRVEFWRLDPYGGEGTPMTSWEEWLNGSRQEPKWGLYNEPHEYFSA